MEWTGNPNKPPSHVAAQIEKAGNPPPPRGAWVTLHVSPPNGEEKQLLGWLIGQEGGQYKLTRLVTTDDTDAQTVYDYGGWERDKQRVIHDGVWLINPAYVWMVEHEKEIPVPGPYPR